MRASSRAFGLAFVAGLAAAPLTAQSEPALRAGGVLTTVPSTPFAPPSTAVPSTSLAPLPVAVAPATGSFAVSAATAETPGASFSPFQEAGPDRARGALWGAGLGLVAGGLLGGLTAGSEEDDDGFGEGLVESAGTAEAVLLGAVAGGAIGALLGATVFAPSRSGGSGGDAPLALEVAPSRRGTGTGVRFGLRWLR